MNDQNLPLVSIIIPIGPGRSYETVLHSIYKLDYPLEKVEVIITEGKQPARQRNEAIKVAKGSIVFFFDDDVVINPDIIKRMLKFYDDPSTSMVGGPNLTPETDSFLQKCFGYCMSSFFATAQMSSRYKSSGHERRGTEKNLICCNVSGRSSILRENLFNETLWPCEENELFNRLQKKGHSFIFDPHSIVYHSRRPSLRKFARQNFGYGRGGIEQILLQPSTFDPLFLTPSLFTLYTLSLPIIAVIPGTWERWFALYSAPMGIYFAISLAIALMTAVSKRNIKIFFLLPYIFFLVHIPYGMGMIYGLFHRLWGKRAMCKEIKLNWIDLSKNRAA
jgi:cellulose synthase/poly-beta-1,6-N-acetylglucosamine synthase-like glycosyltransferase